MEQFGYEKLDVYQCAMEFLGNIYVVIDKLPKGYSHLGDQLRRSSLSIPLNIAEGCGKSSPHERKRFFDIARGSAMESSAVLNCCLALNLAHPANLQKSRSLLFRIVQMLSKMAPHTR
jgi:four helix bundle protein